MKENQVAEQQPSTPTVQQEKPSRKLAFATLILGIVSVFFMAGGALAGVPAVICGHMALSRIKKFPTKYDGRGMAIIGLILGYLMCLATIFCIIAIVQD